MNDTHPLIAKRFKEMMAAKTPEERFLMGCSMFDTAKELAKGGILHEKPYLSPIELRREIFLRFYADDFDKPTLQKILARLDSRSDI